MDYHDRPGNGRIVHEFNVFSGFMAFHTMFWQGLRYALCLCSGGGRADCRDRFLIGGRPEMSPSSERTNPPIWRLTLLLAGLSMFGPFSIDAFFPAFRHIAMQFGVDKTAMQQTISVYLLAFALMSVVHGPLSDAFGRRRVILAGLVTFTGATIGCALAGDMSTLLIFRALQGMSAGVGMIVGRAAIRDLFQGQEAQRLMSRVTMIFGIAPAIAPIVGGWLLGLGWGWAMIFWVLAGFTLLLLASCVCWFPETLPESSRTRLRPGSLLQDYSRIGLDPRFQRLAGACACNFGGIFLYIASAPEFVQGILRLNEQQFGWLFIPLIGGMTLGAFLSSRLAGRVSVATQLRFGFSCTGIGAVCNFLYSVWAPAATVPWAILPIAVMGVGVSLIFPVLTLMILDLYPQQRGTVSSSQAFTQLVLNAAIAGLLSPLLQHRGLYLALGSGCFLLLGWMLWQWDRRAVPLPVSDSR